MMHADLLSRLGGFGLLGPFGDFFAPTGATGPTGKAGSTVTVDVRDMLCAQALAVVAQAVRRLAVGQQLEVSWNAEDVHRDLLVWARERGYDLMDQAGTMTVRVARRR